VRAYLGLTIGFAINPIVAAGQVPALQLRTDADPTPRLGWNTWLTAPPGTRTHDAEEARFDAEVVEALADAPPSTAA
jgi:predicted component of type VI protein secretion system